MAENDPTTPQPEETMNPGPKTIAKVRDQLGVIIPVGGPERGCSMSPESISLDRDNLISKVRAIRAIGDLLCVAAGADREGQQEFAANTLEEIGIHLNELATESLVLLGYEGPKEEPQAAREGGAA